MTELLRLYIIVFEEFEYFALAPTQSLFCQSSSLAQFIFKRILQTLLYWGVTQTCRSAHIRTHFLVWDFDITTLFLINLRCRKVFDFGLSSGGSFKNWHYLISIGCIWIVWLFVVFLVWRLRIVKDHFRVSYAKLLLRLWETLRINCFLIVILFLRTFWFHIFIHR